MAFRELSQNELELLTDSQRRVYEEELEIHRERVKFVEQLEKMENVRFEPFQPTLTPIRSVSRIPEKQYLKQEQVPVQVTAAAAVTVPAAKQINKEPVKAKVMPVDGVSVPAVKPISRKSVKAEQTGEINTIHIPKRVFERPHSAARQIMHPDPVHTPKLHYQNWTHEERQMPVACAVSVPDPYANETLRALLTAANNK